MVIGFQRIAAGREWLIFAAVLLAGSFVR